MVSHHFPLMAVCITFTIISPHLLANCDPDSLAVFESIILDLLTDLQMTVIVVI